MTSQKLTTFLITKNVILGFKKCDMPEKENARIFTNFIVYITKWCIWKHRNDVKYGNSSPKEINTMYEIIVKICKREAKIILENHVHHENSEELCQYLNVMKHTQ